MRIDTNIILALDEFMKANKLSKSDLAVKLGVSGASITKWHRVGSGIINDRWDNQLFPLLKDYLPKDRIYIDDAGNERYSSTAAKQSNYFFEAKYVPAKVPVFSLETISGYDDTIDSVTQFARNANAEYVEFRPKNSMNLSSVFAISTDNEALTNFPFKSMTLFVSSADRPQDNGLVIIRPASGKVFVGNYRRSGQTFTVSEIGGSQVVTGTVAQAKQLINWIFPVSQIEVATF